MPEGPPTITSPLLELLPYQTRIVEFLKRHDPDIWNWFASARQRASHVDELKFDLLKSTYRVDHDSQPELYRIAKQAAKQLGLSLPVTIYQAQDATGMNASLAYLPDEAHIVLHGPLTTQLNQQEL